MASPEIDHPSPAGAKRNLRSFPTSDRVTPFEEQHHVRGRLAVQPLCKRSCVQLAAREAVDHSRPVRGGHSKIAAIRSRPSRHEQLEVGERALEALDTADVGLSVIGADDQCVAVEELVHPPGGLDQPPERCIGTLERRPRILWSREMGGVVVVGKVVEEEIEPVAGDEPAPDRIGVRIDGSCSPRAHRKRRPGDVGLVEVEEEEAPGPVDRLVPPIATRDPGEPNAVAGPRPVAREVHSRRYQPVLLEALEDRSRVRREVRLAHVDDRVPHRIAKPGRTRCGERRAVLDDPLLLAVVPDKVRDPVNVWPSACRDRR